MADFVTTPGRTGSTRSYATMSEALVGEAITRLSAWLSSFDADMHSRYHRPYSNPRELRDDIAVILDALIDRGEERTS